MGHRTDASENTRRADVETKKAPCENVWKSKLWRRKLSENKIPLVKRRLRRIKSSVPKSSI